MKIDNPKVTVITATYNLFKDGRQELFRECVESVHNQTYKNIEHIIIDGDSSDGTLGLIQEYVNKGWLNYYSEKDRGIDDAYNKGLKKAKGKYVAFINSDDSYYDNMAIELSVEKLEKENADYSYGTEQQLYRDGTFFSEFVPKIESFWKVMPFSHQSMLIKKDVINKLGNFVDDFGFGGDVFLVYQLILNDYIGVKIDYIISKYRLGGISNQNTDKKKQRDVWYISGHRLEYLYSQFYKNLDVDICVHILLNGDNPNVYPQFFFQKLMRFMIEKNLKHFNYNKFIDYVDFVASGGLMSRFGINNSTETTTIKIKNPKITTVLYRLFSFIPILKVKIKNNIKQYKLFNFIPLLKIKTKEK